MRNNRVVPSQILMFIDEHFSFARNSQEFNVDLQFKDRVCALIRLIDELPDDLIALEHTQYTHFVLAVETMRSTVGLWDAHGPTPSYTDARLGRAVSRLRQTLITLPDQHISVSIGELAFIRNGKLRESIRTDIESANEALRNGVYKATTVLAGAAI